MVILAQEFTESSTFSRIVIISIKSLVHSLTELCKLLSHLLDTLLFLFGCAFRSTGRHTHFKLIILFISFFVGFFKFSFLRSSKFEVNVIIYLISPKPISTTFPSGSHLDSFRILFSSFHLSCHCKIVKSCSSFLRLVKVSCPTFTNEAESCMLHNLQVVLVEDDIIMRSTIITLIDCAGRIFDTYIAKGIKEQRSFLV